MSQENVALARRGYAALNAAYESGEVNDLLPILDEIWEPDVVLKGTGSVLAGGEEWHGHDGMLRFTASQMEAFQQMSLEPLEFIDAGDQLVVPVRWTSAPHRDRGRVPRHARLHVPRRQGHPDGHLREQGRGPRSRGAAGVAGAI